MVRPHRTVELSGVDCVLSLAIGEDDWTQVLLAAEGGRLALGAEKLPYVVGKLTAFLGRDDPRPRWVLSLSELHFSFYGAHVDGKSVLTIQDPDARFVTRIVVDADQKHAWLAALGELVA